MPTGMMRNPPFYCAKGGMGFLIDDFEHAVLNWLLTTLGINNAILTRTG